MMLLRAAQRQPLLVKTPASCGRFYLQALPVDDVGELQLQQRP
jgi:hypothetical protein